MLSLFNRPKLRFQRYEVDGDPLPGVHAFHVQSRCPTCQWAPPEDNPEEMYVMAAGIKGINVVLNYWTPANKERSSYMENKKITKHVNCKIYPVHAKGHDNMNGGQDWLETHCCPVHGEWSFWNGWP